jgi:pimeloyl-ACP methyl ester carboxylesterase
MKKRIAALAGLAGTTAAVNRALTDRAGDLEPALSGSTGTYEWRGVETSYAEAGDPDDPDLLLVHGVHAAASNKEFDRVFDRLAEAYHVIAPDLPGFGLSERPPLVYSGSLYTAFLADFAAAHLEDATCVATSLSGAYAAAVQAESEPFSRLVLVCPTDDTGDTRPLLRALVRTPLVGTALFNLLTSRPSLRLFGGRQSVKDPAALTDDDVDHYWRTAHQPGARFAPASFVAGSLDPATDLRESLRSVDVPVTLVWGRDATFPSVEQGKELAAATGSRLVVLDEARLLPHHEHPEEFLGGLERELTALAV